ncbi:MAG: cytochrome c [Planctomycetales bacterium]|nr:cytochrome c [Planctomycetales bacterium]
MRRNWIVLVVVLLGLVYFIPGRGTEAADETEKTRAEKDAAPAVQPVHDNRVAEAQAGQDEEEGEHPANFWMNQKLRYSQNIFAALTTADFPAIHENASRMKRLNKIEKFFRRQPEGYNTQLRLFNHATNELIVAAEHENLGEATLAFNQLTVSCVACHKHLRESPEETEAGE